MPGELIAAFLYAQLEEAEKIIAARLQVWDYYHQLLEPLEKSGKLRRPIIPPTCQHNGHMYYILLDSLQIRTSLISYLKEQGMSSVFHYVPLHSSPAGQHYGRVHGDMNHTNHVSDCLLRLPLFPELGLSQIETVVMAINSFFDTCTY
ncbi:DegT/DnrJ/EryC1/StrS family aminotransferase [Aphanizomenon sp. PH219]|nr:DegT/DnrJ/EryC1/StrS family aminotransferase [Aphanizomenon sp. 202]MDK2460406.1 DegT/DnrJ/EryC1/StrS family aminotransferase [Aphanizomenon sp. PH219]